MAGALAEILGYKADEVAQAKAARSLSELAAAARDQAAPRGFIAALDRVAQTDDNALICELKRKSPSAGEILPGADPVEIAAQYEAGGAACVSVLTDAPRFGGCLADLDAIRARVALPLLRKDFMIDPWQVSEARAHGADAILVIMAAVEEALARDLVACAHDFGMDALIEVHDRAELDRALGLTPTPRLVGINNRDLTTMTTDLSVTERLSRNLPGGVALVSESGIAEAGDIIRLRRAGARRFLIGEHLMKRANRARAVTGLKQARED